MSDCQSCKEERRKKNLPPMEVFRLPEAITPAGQFRRPQLHTIVCPHCDGDSLVASALRAHQERQGK